MSEPIEALPKDLAIDHIADTSVIPKLRLGAVTCRGRYEVTTTIEGSEKTLHLSAYATHSYKACPTEEGNYRIAVSKRPREIRIIVETPGVKIPQLPKSDLASLRNVIKMDLESQFKIKFGQLFKDTKASVSRGMDTGIEAESPSNPEA